jgi:membrane-bound lytic murein transglycosylase B
MRQPSLAYGVAVSTKTIITTEITPRPTRRTILVGLAGSTGALFAPQAARADTSFDHWVAAFRSKAVARGISDETYTRAMRGVQPDMTGLTAIHNQPEFNQQLWQYLNRATTEWKVTAGKAKAAEYAPLFSRIQRDIGVEPSFMLGVWGIESAFGDPVVEKNHMRPVIPSLATLAWGEPRRRSYWESELINALMIVQRGMSTPEQMIGSWAGAMGHTQWMPEVWLHMGIDYNGDGKISPYGPPDDALATTARYFVERGNYHRGEHWGYEVRMPRPISGKASRTYAAWQTLGIVRADGEPYPQLNATARAWVPIAGGPAFLLGQNFFAARSYNPAMSYALGLVYLGDRCVGRPPFVQQFPGSEPAPTLAEIEEIQRRLTALGFDTGGADGRIGNATAIAVRDYQRKFGIEPADGYPGVELLARLRRAS